jgi:hypothetical protein
MEHFTGAVETILVQQLSNHGATLVLHTIQTRSLVTIEQTKGNGAKHEPGLRFQRIQSAKAP